MMPIMVEYGSGAPINTINFILSILLGPGSFFVTLNLHKYALKRGPLPLDLYTNISKSEELRPPPPHPPDNRLNRALFLATENYLVPL